MASATRDKLDRMNSGWEKVLGKTRDKQLALEAGLREARAFHGEMADMLLRLSEIDGQLATAKPVGGLPETAKEQLTKFMETYGEIEAITPKVEALKANGATLLEKSSDISEQSLKQQLGALQQRWDNIMANAGDRKTKLEEAVQQAESFHEDLNNFISWLTHTEKNLNNLKPVSRILDKVNDQVEEHKVLQKDISGHREAMVNLDATGTHLKYFSQKQDVILIKNLLVSVQHRWEKVVSRSAERTRHLDHAYKDAKQFETNWSELMGWLDQNTKALKEDISISNDPDKIKEQITNHKDFQRTLGAKQPAFDTVMRQGRNIKDKSPKVDGPVVQEKLNEMKTMWNKLCAASVNRQQALEEALLFSGQFKEALQALLDWLYKVEPQLTEDEKLHGDLDTVQSLVEEHKSFQQELGRRTENVGNIKKAARRMMEASDEDHSHLEGQLIDLSTKWEQVCKASVKKQEQLDVALHDAEDFHKKTHMLLEWLAEAERTLRYQGPLPEEEGALLEQLEQHQVFAQELAVQEGKLGECVRLGQEILRQCHPDAVTTVKHWLTILQARWEEVSSWAAQRENKLQEALGDMRANAALLDELMGWLTGAKATLLAQDSQPIPENIPIIEQLLHDHQTFQADISGRQPDVDRITKQGKKASSGTDSLPRQRRSTSGRPPQKKDGKKTPEPEFKDPRVGALFNNWRQVWLMAMERQRKLQDALDYLNELEKMKNFDFDDWRKRYMDWMNNNKSRVMDFFRRQDRDHDGKVTRQEFIDGILASRFPTSRMEMEAVADIFDKDGDGFIDYKEFVAALRPDRSPQKTPQTDGERIHDELKKQVNKCTCTKQFRIHKIGEGRYRFGESQKLRLVRILRSTVMVRVGGGWVALDEFLVKNDPCRAKGRTNLELREQFILPQGASQSMTHFVTKQAAAPSRASGGSVHSSASTTSWGTQSTASSMGPITKIREKTQYSTPWRQTRSRVSPDTEVRQILSPSPKPGSGARPRTPLRSPANPRMMQSPASSGGKVGSRPSSRASSRCSVSSDISEPEATPEVFTTMKTETRNVGGRTGTTVTYQTHTASTRSVTTPTAARASNTTSQSRIPKPSSGGSTPRTPGSRTPGTATPRRSGAKTPTSPR